MPKHENEPLRSWGDWDVMPDCSIRNKKRRIEIYPDMLNQPDLLLNMHANRVLTDTDWSFFMPAMFFACRAYGIYSITVTTDYQ